MILLEAEARALPRVLDGAAAVLLHQALAQAFFGSLQGGNEAGPCLPESIGL